MLSGKHPNPIFVSNSKSATKKPIKLQRRGWFTSENPSRNSRRSGVKWGKVGRRKKSREWPKTAIIIGAERASRMADGDSAIRTSPFRRSQISAAKPRAWLLSLFISLSLEFGAPYKRPQMWNRKINEFADIIGAIWTHQCPFPVPLNFILGYTRLFQTECGFYICRVFRFRRIKLGVVALRFDARNVAKIFMKLELFYEEYCEWVSCDYFSIYSVDKASWKRNNEKCAIKKVPKSQITIQRIHEINWQYLIAKFQINNCLSDSNFRLVSFGCILIFLLFSI